MWKSALAESLRLWKILLLGNKFRILDYMDASNLDDLMVLVPRIGIPAPVRDERSSFQRRFAIYLLLLSIFLERIAFYSLSATLSLTLHSLSWTSKNSIIGSFLFSGEYF